MRGSFARARWVLAVSVLALGLTGFIRAPLQEAALHGLWARPASELGPDELRFYYFHPGGTGLYRYGRRGLNNTHSFDYRLEGSALVLRFRKTGAEHRVPIALSQADGTAWLELAADPREAGPTRYRRVMGPLGAQAVLRAPGDAGEHPFARMWTELTEYATGGKGFAIYQLQPPEGGRGVGWYHQGDFDDWSTEALTYEVRGDQLTLQFVTRGERATTRMAERREGGRRSLLLERDPRNFWHRRNYLDAGRTIFGARAFSVEPLLLQLSP
jgi:hypothetical protein